MGDANGIPWSALGAVDWACIVATAALPIAGVVRLAKGDATPSAVPAKLPPGPFPDPVMPLVAVTAFILTFGILVSQPAFLVGLAGWVTKTAGLDGATLLGGRFEGRQLLAGLLGQLLAAAALLALARAEPTLIHHRADAEDRESLRPDGRSALRLAGLFAGGTALMAAAMAIWWLFVESAAGQGLELPADNQLMVEALLDHSGAAWPVVVTGLYVGLGAPLVEEIGFRGMIYPALRRTLPRGWAVALTGATFAVIHGNLATLLPIGVLGAWLCLVRDRFGLATCVALHVMVNLWSFAWLLLAPDVARHF